MSDEGLLEHVGGIEAVARGLADGGVAFTTAYPGFHAHDLAAQLGCSAFSVNEKNALAVTWGASLAGLRSAAVFKNVGLNDAADPFLNTGVLGVHAGLVVVVLDDIDVEQSQLCQDSRGYADLFPCLWLEPRSLADAYDLARLAPGLSEQLGSPVVLRLTNLLAHATGTIRRRPGAQARRPFLRAPERWVVHPVNAASQRQALAIRQEAIARWVGSAYDPPGLLDGPRVRVSVGMAGADQGPPADLQVFTLPLPRPWLHALARSSAEVHVAEHGNPIVAGKIAAALGAVRVTSLPACCPASLHRYRTTDRYEPIYGMLRGVPGRVVVGDLGGHTMDPARSVDACLCYGCSVGVATGLAAAGAGLPIFCVTGDAAFLHSGKTALAEAEARRSPITVLVLDNGGSMGTGGQRPPGRCEPDSPGEDWHELDFAEAAAGALGPLLDGAAGRDGPRVIRIRTPF
jgi:indolepyruvate ferredoxin oxidoreductase alpha subunit